MSEGRTVEIHKRNDQENIGSTRVHLDGHWNDLIVLPLLRVGERHYA